MKVLIDTHVLLWWLTAPERLSSRGRDIFASGANVLHWSAASSWEIAIKAGLGRIALPAAPRVFLPRVLREQSIRPLDVTHAHALTVADLPQHHRDPFDRLLVATARVEKLALLSSDRAFDAYDVRRLW